MVSHLAQEWHILVTDRECLDLTGFADSDTPQLRFKMENLVHGQLVVERAYMIDPTRRFCKLEYRRLSVNEVLLRGQVVRITQLRSEHSASARWRMWTTDPVECRFKEEPISSELLNAVLCKAFDAVLSEAQAVDYETYPYFDLARSGPFSGDSSEPREGEEMQVAWSEQKQEWEEWGQYRSWEGARGFDTNEYGPQRPGTIAARRIRDQFAIPKGSLPLSVVIRSSPDALREHASQFAVGA